MKHALFKLVLVEQIHEFEIQGWQRVNNRVHVVVGGWYSVYMRKEVESEEVGGHELSGSRDKRG